MITKYEKNLKADKVTFILNNFEWSQEILSIIQKDFNSLEKKFKEIDTRIEHQKENIINDLFLLSFVIIASDKESNFYFKPKEVKTLEGQETSDLIKTFLTPVERQLVVSRAELLIRGFGLFYLRYLFPEIRNRNIVYIRSISDLLRDFTESKEQKVSIRMKATEEKVNNERERVDWSGKQAIKNLLFDSIKDIRVKRGKINLSSVHREVIKKIKIPYTTFRERIEKFFHYDKKTKSFLDIQTKECIN